MARLPFNPVSSVRDARFGASSSTGQMMSGNSDSLEGMADLRHSLSLARKDLLRTARPRRRLGLLLEPSVARRAMRDMGLVRPDWSRVERLVFACIGNICRSAYANAVMADRGIPAASFGFRAQDGQPADPEAIAHARERGYDLSSHATLAAGSVEVRPSDCLLLMDIRHLDAARELSAQTGMQYYPLGYYLEPPTRTVPDPYGGSPELFRFTFAMIDLGAEILVRDMAREGQLERIRALGG